MAGRFPVTERMLSVVVVAWTAHGGMRRDDPIRERGQGCDDLEHRAGRILSLRGTVVQREMWVGAQGAPRGWGGAWHKRVRIKRWLTRQRENLAVTRVKGHNGAPMTFKETLSELLELEIEGKDEIHPRRC